MSALSETSLTRANTSQDGDPAVPAPFTARAASRGVIAAAAELQCSVADLKATNADIARQLRDRQAS